MCHYKQTPVLSCFETVWCVILNNTHRTSILQPKQFQSTAGFALCRLPRTLLRVTSANGQQRAKWTTNSTHSCDSYGGSDGSEGVVFVAGRWKEELTHRHVSCGIPQEELLSGSTERRTDTVRFLWNTSGGIISGSSDRFLWNTSGGIIRGRVIGFCGIRQEESLAGRVNEELTHHHDSYGICLEESPSGSS